MSGVAAADPPPATWGVADCACGVTEAVSLGDCVGVGVGTADEVSAVGLGLADGLVELNDGAADRERGATGEGERESYTDAGSSNSTQSVSAKAASI